MEVDWQNNLHCIKDRGFYILDSEKWADCRFLVGSAPNHRIIAGHKLILAMASPVFEAMFFGYLPNATQPIVIPDVQPDAFQSMLEYIYSDRISITTFDKACELCYVAKKYMLPHVVEQCTHFLWADLSPKNACRAYEFAKLFDEPRLIHSSMEIISAKTREVISDPSFYDIEYSTLMTILDQEKLNIDNELELFNALVRYAAERGIITDSNTDAQARPSDNAAGSSSGTNENSNDVVEEIKMEPDVAAIMHSHEDGDAPYDVDDAASEIADDVIVVDNDAADNESMRGQVIDESMLRQAVKKIRFLTMTPQQFAEGPARSKLLQQHEALAILIKISSPTIVDAPMPEGFCSSRCTRNYYEPRCQRELSSYRHSVPSNGSSSSCYAPIEMQNPPIGVAPSTTSSMHQQMPILVNNLSNYNESELSNSETRRNFCVRTTIDSPHFDYRNTSVTDCSLTFQVDTNIWITGVQVPTQVLCGELMNSAGFSEIYTEVLYAHIQDIQGSRLSYTHCTSRVGYDSYLEISFDRPAYIYRHRTYKVFVVFNKVGWYPMYSCSTDVICNRVKFSFNVGNSNESQRNGLIRAIVFSTPQ